MRIDPRALIGSRVVITTDDLSYIRGRLLQIDHSKHGKKSVGNVLLEREDGSTVIVRGSHVGSIGVLE